MSDSLRIERDRRIAYITLDKPDDKVNILDKSLIEGFGTVLDSVEKDDSIDTLVFISAKEGNFIAGADINMFDTFTETEEFEAFIKNATDLLDRIEQFPKPVIAAINGSCVGGGLELILACHARIATDDSSTKFSLPEVKLGLLPGAGGTQRLPRLVGLPSALDIMLTGKNVFPRQAKKMGLIDDLTHKHGLRQAAEWMAGKLKKDGAISRKLSLTNKALTHSPLRSVAFSQAEKQVMKSTRGNYPAPLKILESARAGLTKTRDKGFETERRLFSRLAFTPESAALRSLFFAMQGAKKNPFKEKAAEVRKIGILGAGLMGSGIADVSSKAGLQVVLKDRDIESAMKGYHSVEDDLRKKIKKRIISKFDSDAQMERITPTSNYGHLRGVPVIIEAVFEELDIKHQVLNESMSMSPDAIFASNTSSIPISDIAKKAEHPENVIGMHYFSPVQKMPLLEIIKTKQTSAEAIGTAYEIGLKQGKTVIVVHDGPGFYTTRILAPFIHEAMLLLGEGASVESIDSAMKDFGFPVGPVALIDEVGIDVAAHVSATLAPMFRERGAEPGNTAQKIHDAGYLGRKNKKGFYRYDKAGKGKKKVNEDIYAFFGGSERKKIDKTQIQQRMSSVMVNEAMLCLEEHILDSARDGDLGAVLGLGFPPFLGGPFHYTDQIGVEQLLEQLNKLESAHGNRFKAAGILQEYLKSGRKFRDEA